MQNDISINIISEVTYSVRTKPFPEPEFICNCQYSIGKLNGMFPASYPGLESQQKQ